MAQEIVNLRELQRDHSLILLSRDEFEKLKVQRALKLPDRHHEHFGRVLRRRGAWPALVSDGEGNLASANVDKGQLLFQSMVTPLPPAARRIHLVQAWVKQKALALILQKSAEIGVNEIHLVDTEYSQPHSEKAARIDAILENACMQAHNPLKPRIIVAPKLEAIRPELGAAYFGDLESRQSLAAVKLQSEASAYFFNGPEGGFSPAETEFLRSFAHGVLLSENVLRSESAAIIALGYLRLPA